MRTSFLISVETEVYWLGYQHGHQGLPKRDLYADKVSKAYQEGYDDGIQSLENERLGNGKPEWSSPRTTSRVCALLDEIQSHEDTISGLKKEITRLEAG